MGCVGHTAWAPKGRERRSQEPGRASSQKSGPGGAPRLLVEYENGDEDYEEHKKQDNGDGDLYDNGDAANITRHVADDHEAAMFFGLKLWKKSFKNSFLFRALFKFGSIKQCMS